MDTDTILLAAFELDLFLPSIERAMKNRMTRKILSSSLEGKEILQFAKDAAAGIAEVPSLPDLTSGITKKEKKSSKRK